MALVPLHAIDEAYPYALNDEEKPSRGNVNSIRNKGEFESFIGRGRSS